MASQFTPRDAVRPLESAFFSFVFAAERPSAQAEIDPRLRPCLYPYPMLTSFPPSVHLNPLFTALRNQLLDIYFAAVWLGVWSVSRNATHAVLCTFLLSACVCVLAR